MALVPSLSLRSRFLLRREGRNERRNGRLSLCYNSCSSKSILAKFEMLHRSNPAHLLRESNYFFFVAGNCVSPPNLKNIYPHSCSLGTQSILHRRIDFTIENVRHSLEFERFSLRIIAKPRPSEFR